jgi:hypothetical protein
MKVDYRLAPSITTVLGAVSISACASNRLCMFLLPHIRLRGPYPFRQRRCEFELTTPPKLKRDEIDLLTLARKDARINASHLELR